MKAGFDFIPTALNQRFIQHLVDRLFLHSYCWGMSGTSSPVPRPWELTPGTSVLNQLVRGDGGLTERVRKGLAQVLGRYATNIKAPIGYGLPTIRAGEIVDYAKAVITDDPRHTWAEGMRASDSPVANTVAARATLYREMFDLAPFDGLRPHGMEKTGPKEYHLKARAENFCKRPAEGTSGAGEHSILGGVYLNSTGEGGHSFRDTWDIVTSGEEKGVPSSYDPEQHTRKVRLLLSKLLRPATVKGEVVKPDVGSGDYPQGTEPKDIMKVMGFAAGGRGRRPMSARLVRSGGYR